MEKILEAIKEKLNMGYTINNLEVDFGYPDDQTETEGYYLSKLNGWGATPITEVLCEESEVDFNKLVIELDKLRIAYCN